MTDEPSIADAMPEPDDGTAFLLEGDGTCQRVWRDDEAAREYCEPYGNWKPEERWFYSYDEWPETWRDIVSQGWEKLYLPVPVVDLTKVDA